MGGFGGFGGGLDFVYLGTRGQGEARTLRVKGGEGEAGYCVYSEGKGRPWLSMFKEGVEAWVMFV